MKNCTSYSDRYAHCTAALLKLPFVKQRLREWAWEVFTTLGVALSYPSEGSWSPTDKQAIAAKCNELGCFPAFSLNKNGVSSIMGPRRVPDVKANHSHPWPAGMPCPECGSFHLPCLRWDLALSIGTDLWTDDDLDRLAAGSESSHLCGVHWC